MNIIEQLTNKDDKKAYEFCKKLCVESAKSDEFYSFFDDFVSLLCSTNSYIRTRGFILCCAQARWDKEGKIKKSIKKMFVLLHDEKPSVIRQCLKALQEVAIFRTELTKAIKKELDTIDLDKYKDSMASLIRKDIEELKRMID